MDSERTLRIRQAIEAVDKYHFKTTERNTDLLKARNCTICVNIFCEDVTEHPINFENCPSCGKLLSKSIKGAKLYDLCT